MRRRNYVGEPALVCDREFCPRKVQLWFTHTKLGRAFLSVWLVLVIVAGAGMLVGCDPSDGKSKNPKPLQTGEQPAHMYTVITPK